MKLEAPFYAQTMEFSCGSACAFTREGSGFILLTGLVVVALHAPHFTTIQLVLALAIVPLAMTLAEAFSPHTWDTPTLMFAGYGGLLLVMQF